MGRIRRYLIAGLLIWIPIGITIVVFRVVLGQMNKSLGLLPREHVPAFVFEIPYLGVILTFLLLLVTGLLTANIFGKTLVGWSEKLLQRIPLIRAVYSASKNFAEVVFSPSGDSFKQVLLIEYPRKGVWSLAFMTSNPLGEVQHRTAHRELSVFSSSYAEAEQAFLGAVSALGLPARLTSLPYEGSGPSGESLATRQVWIGDQDAPRVLVLLSAVHG
ncbi:MAG: DUF2817 domain-containing protein, partial [Pseudomonadota bacterium]